MPVQDETDVREMAEACVDDMGDIFWEYEPERDRARDFTDPRQTALASVAAALGSMQNKTDRNSLCPRVLRSEYETLVAEAGRNPSDARLVAALVKDADWTRQGADEVVRLARQYGTSILRNALALADALGVEDGSRGF